MSADAVAIIAIMLVVLTLSHVARTIVLLNERGAPEIEDSPVWSAPPPAPPALEDALSVVLARGDHVRRCLKCQSPATDIKWLGYRWSGSSVWAAVTEDCIACGNTTHYNVPQVLWACMETSSAWESMRSAKALFESEQSESLDLPAD